MYVFEYHSPKLFNLSLQGPTLLINYPPIPCPGGGGGGGGGTPCWPPGSSSAWMVVCPGPVPGIGSAVHDVTAAENNISSEKKINFFIFFVH